MKAWWMWALLGAGCSFSVGNTDGDDATGDDVNGDDDDDDDDDPIDLTEDQCQGTPPVLVDVGCEGHDDDEPSIACFLEMTDEDGDLHDFELGLAIDGTFDGVVGSRMSWVPASALFAGECDVTDFSDDLFVIPYSGIYGQWQEARYVVRDAAGLESNEIIRPFCPPRRNGGVADCGPKPPPPAPVDTADTGW